MTGVLLILQFVLAVLITIVILLQKSSSIGLGAYSGSNESLFGAKGPNAFLAKTTSILGILFVINTVALTYLYYQERTASVVDSAVVPASVEIPASPTPSAPEAPQSR
ncbi:MAG: preprotein translocase subunit SecG [Campylobacterales bacterium]